MKQNMHHFMNDMHKYVFDQILFITKKNQLVRNCKNTIMFIMLLLLIV